MARPLATRARLSVRIGRFRRGFWLQPAGIPCIFEFLVVLAAANANVIGVDLALAREVVCDPNRDDDMDTAESRCNAQMSGSLSPSPLPPERGPQARLIDTAESRFGGIDQSCLGSPLWWEGGGG